MNHRRKKQQQQQQEETTMFHLNLAQNIAKMKHFDEPNSKLKLGTPNRNRTRSIVFERKPSCTINPAANILEKLMLATKRVVNLPANKPQQQQQQQQFTGAQRPTSGGLLLRRHTSLNISSNGNAGQHRSSIHKETTANLGRSIRRTMSLANGRQQNQQQQQPQTRINLNRLTQRWTHRISTGSLRLVDTCNRQLSANNYQRKSQSFVSSARHSLSNQSMKQRKSKDDKPQVAARGVSLLRLASCRLAKSTTAKGSAAKAVAPTTTTTPASSKTTTTKRDARSSFFQNLTYKKSKPTTSGGRHTLHMLVFILINALLLLSLGEGPRQVAFGAPLVLLGRRQLQQQSPVTSIWLSDGLLTVDPTTSGDQDEDEGDDNNNNNNNNNDDNQDTYLRGEDQQQQQQPTQFVQMKPRRNWFSLAADEEGQQAAGEPQLQPPEEPAEEQQEALWIQRRRLNRDRALEPPAWLRERPIRRDDGLHLVAGDSQDETDGKQSLASSTDKQSEADQPSLESAAIRGRQLRQSNELYDEILRHLIEEALDSRDFLEDLYNELESRLSKSPSSPAALAAGKSSSGGASLDLGTPKGLATFEQANGAAKLLGDVQKGAGLASLGGGGGDDSSLVVVNDEVSDNTDDVVSIQQPQQQPQQQQSTSERLLDSIIGGTGQLAQRPNQLALQKQLAHLMSGGAPEGGQSSVSLDQMSLVGPQQQQSMGGADSKGNLIELLQTSLAASPQNDQFHVVEDIDQVDQTNNQASPIQVATGGSIGGGPSPMDSDKQQLLEEWRQVTSSSGGDDGLEEQSAMQKRQISNLLMNLDEPSEEDNKSEQDDKDDDNQREEEEELLVVPVRKSAPWMSSSGSKQQRPSTANNLNPSQLPALALRLIHANYFSRKQLNQLATRLRYYLEDEMDLPRNSIAGLFPMGGSSPQQQQQQQQQLLVELDQSRLEARDRLNLMQNFAYLRGSLLLGWPRASRHNPVPILEAILEALKRDDANDDEQAPGDTSPAARQLAPTDDDEPLQLQPPTSRRGRLLLALPPILVALRVPSGARDQMSRQPTFVYNSPLNKQLTMDEQDVDSITTTTTTEDDNNNEDDDDDDKYSPYGLEQPLGDSSFGQHWQVASAASAAAAAAATPLLGRPAAATYNYENGGRQFAALLAYLSAVERGQPDDQPLVRDTFQAVALRQPAAAAAAAVSNQKTKHSDSRRSFCFHLVAVLVALAASFVIVKLIMRRLDGQLLRQRLGRARGSFRSLWSNGSSGSSSASNQDEPEGVDHQSKRATISSSALVVGDKSKHLNELEAGNFGRRYSADSGLETIGGASGTTDDTHSSGDGSLKSPSKSRKHLDLLGQRLMATLTFGGSKHSATGETASKCDLDNRQVAKNNTQESIKTDPPTTERPFRTSRSYIKSLIDALTTARSQVHLDSSSSSANNNHSNGGRPIGERDDYEDDDDEEEEEEEDDDDSEKQLIRQQRQQVGADGIIVSQMDISAAHLILDYMEKHLEDKERLRREWLELNATNQSQPLSLAQPQQQQHQHQQQQPSRDAKSKANQLVLRRLAKVGLMEENRDKNRNPCVVPFDRNRVRLRTGVAVNDTTSTTNSGASSSKQKTRQTGKQQPQQRRQPAKRMQTSDYINASFIYDDDPRRPTHIIAQGPNEQTIGQFWQMIWEQEVSVIVMLTRLNERGQQMCHCYWPTGGASSSTTTTTTTTTNLSGDQQTADQTTDSPAKSPASARRSSVTSVFSASAIQPIVAVNEGLSDNVLYFEVGGHPSGKPQSPPIDEEGFASYPTEESNDDHHHQRTIKLEVHLISEHVSSNDYLVRNMYLINRSTGETRTISQFHYLAWPEGKTPDNVRSLLQFRRTVLKSYRNLRSPILVHCSDGAGRSGTYTLLDLILERIKNGAKEIDPRATLEHLRDQRIGLCATQSQFEFVLVALAEEIQIILNALPK